MSAKTVFLSHRRKDFGKHFARSVQLALKAEGFDVFLDVETIEAGKWETQILAGVAERAHFLLLLTPGCFDGCDSPDDWVRREFERAVETQRNIVLIFEQDALYAELQAHCPDPVRSIFGYQGHRIHDTSFDADIKILREKYLHPSKAPSASVPIKDEILQRLDTISAQQKVTAARIRVHLLESTERHRDADLAAAEKATPSAERQRLRETALAAHQSRLSRIDELALSFAEIEGRADSTAVFKEMTRILAEEGVDPTLAYIATQKGGILDRIRRRKQIEQEQSRTELQPLLSAADLQATKGQTVAALATYRGYSPSTPHGPPRWRAPRGFSSTRPSRTTPTARSWPPSPMPRKPTPFPPGCTPPSRPPRKPSACSAPRTLKWATC